MTFDSFVNLHIIKNKNVKKIKEAVEDIKINLREYQRQNKNNGQLSEDTINRIHATEESDLKSIVAVVETIEHNIDLILLNQMKKNGK